ncbi:MULTISPECIES: AraC family transcriptional regulator [unclassified Mycobacteroides]|uniref:AraC family transcriptional regulator n=1 Tax=unclassified Mycobacteroides TaxID=2618759 RepID=UPI001396C3C0|nr:MULTISPECIES: AraC family transcriptional regulator [unclassified Mycobacteroides]
MHTADGTRDDPQDAVVDSKNLHDWSATLVPTRRVEAMLALAARERWDMVRVLRDAGVDPQPLIDGRARMNYDQFTTVVRLLWGQTDDELAGLGPGPMPRGTTRLIGCAVFSASSDVEAMIARFEILRGAVPGFPPVHIERTADELEIRFDIGDVDKPVELLVDLILMSILRLAEWGIGRKVPVHRVEVPYLQPEDVDDYELLFGAPVRFGAPLPTLVLDAALLSAPVVRTEADFDDFISQSPEDVLFRRRGYEVSTAEQVRRMTEQGIGGQWPTTSAMAMRLGVSAQTLRRRLREEGSSVRVIRDEVLRDAAIASLSRGDEKIAVLSERLGFSEPSAFNRAFRRWTGSAPSAYRSYQQR